MRGLRWFLVLASACTGEVEVESGVPACAAAPGDLAAECACDEPLVEVGGGTQAFESVAEGQAVTMVHGPQGGWHVLASARLGNLAPIVLIHYSITDVASGVVVSDNNYRVLMVQDSECFGFYPGMYGYLVVSDLIDGESDTPPELLAGRELLLQMEVTDTDERVATDTLTVVAEKDPVDE